MSPVCGLNQFWLIWNWLMEIFSDVFLYDTNSACCSNVSRHLTHIHRKFPLAMPIFYCPRQVVKCMCLELFQIYPLPCTEMERSLGSLLYCQKSFEGCHTNNLQFVQGQQCVYFHWWPPCVNVQFGPIITHYFPPKYSQQIPHSSQVRVRYGVSFVSSIQDLCSAFMCHVAYNIPLQVTMLL